MLAERKSNKYEDDETLLAKAEYDALSTEMDDALIRLEESMLMKKKIEITWFKEFGGYRIKINHLNNEISKLNIEIDFIKTGQVFSKEELKDKINLILKQRQDEIDKERKYILEAALSSISINTKKEPVTISQYYNIRDEIAKYKLSNVKYRRQIWMLSHPDIINKLNFSENNKMKLNELIRKVNEPVYNDSEIVGGFLLTD